MQRSDHDDVLDLIRKGYGYRSKDSIEWSLLKSPIFIEEYSALAEIDGQVVGCWLSTIQNLKIAPDLVVPAGSGLVVVHPDFRRRGIGTRLYIWRRKLQSTRQDQLLGYGVASPETRRFFWSRVSPSRQLPDRATVYTKIISTKPVEKAIKATFAKVPNQGSQSNKWPLNLLVHLSGLPVLNLAIDPEGVSLSNKDMTDITIQGEIQSLKMSSILLSLLARRIRISGLRHIGRLLSCLKSLHRFAKSLDGI